MKFETALILKSEICLVWDLTLTLVKHKPPAASANESEMKLSFIQLYYIFLKHTNQFFCSNLFHMNWNGTDEVVSRRLVVETWLALTQWQNIKIESVLIGSHSFWTPMTAFMRLAKVQLQLSAVRTMMKFWAWFGSLPTSRLF